MKILKKSQKKKNKGQAMVEFALVLPLLLLIILGLMEAGRLLFIYGFVTTASREAVRYGSATGDNGAGTPKYLDCDGIRTSAQEMGFILPIDATDIDIQYERGGTSIGNCNGTTYSGPALQNGDRISIEVIGNYAPMVPMGGFAAFPITTASKRTIFIGITVAATAGVAPPAADLSFTKTASPTTFAVAGDTITYTFTLENTGDFDLTGTNVDDPMLGGTVASCSGISIPQGQTRTCSKTYSITAADITAAEVTGSVTNTATADVSDGTNSLSRSASATVSLADRYEITLSKTPSKTSTTTIEAITYTYTITNTGNQDLTTFSISDVTDRGIIVSVSCPSTTLVPGNSLDCTSSYTITQGDLDAGSVTNTAMATATDGGTNTATASAQATVTTKPLVLTIFTTPAPPYDEAGDIILYTYHLENIGTEDLTNFSIIDDRFTGITCPNVILAPMETTDCTYSYTILQEDVDLGFMENNATGYADNGNISSSPWALYIEALQIPRLTLEKSGPPTALVENDISYTYTLTNTGNVSLKAPYTITDDIITDPSKFDCSAATSPLLPDEITSCTGTYTITTEDLDIGSVVNIATVTADLKITALDGTENITSPSDTYTVYTFDGPRIRLEKAVNKAADAGIGDTVVYVYKITNTGNTILSGNYTIEDDILDETYNNGVDCTGNDHIVLQLRQSIICTGVYIIDTRDLDAGGNLTNIARAFAYNGATSIPSNQDSVSFTVSIPLPVCTYPVYVPGSSTDYDVGDYVTYNSQTWKCVKSVNNSNKTPSDTSTYWTKVNDCTMP